MLSSLVAGISPGMSVNTNINANANTITNGFAVATEQESPRPGVVLRREQVRLVLFEGKSEVADVEDPPSHGHNNGTLPPLPSSQLIPIPLLNHSYLHSQKTSQQCSAH
jgi:hypothetical protein